MGNSLHFPHCLRRTHLGAKDGGARNDDLGAGSEDILQIVRTDTPIHLDPGFIIIRYDNILEPVDFFYH